MSGINNSGPTRGNKRPASPGPGSYENADSLHYKKMPGSKIGKDKRESFFLKTTVTGTPDAGLYNKPGFDKLNRSTFSFGKSSRPPVLARGPPGPGEYNLRADLGSGVPKYSMPGRGTDLRPKVGVDAPSPS